MNSSLRLGLRAVFIGLAAQALCGCTHTAATDQPQSAALDATTRALRSEIDTIVVIYAENRAFDNLYGNFPGAPC